jgi:hypothetical protein
MARSRRRATRRGVQKDSELQSESPSIDAEVANEEDRCPACKGDAAEEFQGVKESWIECDACKIWFHWRCAGNGGDMELINRWCVLQFISARRPPVINTGTASHACKPIRRTSSV